MKYKTESDLRKRFTEEEFAKKVDRREVEVDKYRAAWIARKVLDNVDILRGDHDPKPILETAHWIITFSNSEETRLGWAGSSYTGYDDKTFEAITDRLNRDGFTHILARHATVKVYTKAGR